MCRHLPEHPLHRLGGADPEELVDVHEADPDVFLPVDRHAVLVHGELLGEALAEAAPTVIVVEMEGEGTAGNGAVGFDG